MSSLKTGARLVLTDQTDQILQIEDGIKFLNTKDNGIAFIKKLLANRAGKVAKSYKYQWDETALPARRETVTMLIGDGTVTVSNSAAYHVGDILKVESEVMRVTALTNATTLTVTRGYAGTAAAAHTAKTMFNLGYAAVENSTGPDSMTTTSSRLYNYVEQFEDAVELSDLQIATLTTDGNPLDRQLERITFSFWKRFANAAMKGVRYEDTSLNIHLMGGLDQFVTTNVTSVGGALSITNLDDNIYNQVIAGGNPDTIVCHPYQKRKLDALDNNLIRTGKRDGVAGGGRAMTWQSGILDHDLDIIVDHTVGTDELYILDSSTMAIIPLDHNGIDGRLSIVDATAKGQSGVKKLLRAYYTLEVETESANGKLTTLT